MAAQRQIPGGAFVNETATAQRQVPASVFINETAAAKLNTSTIVRQAVNRASTY